MVIVGDIRLAGWGLTRQVLLDDLRVGGKARQEKARADRDIPADPYRECNIIFDICRIYDSRKVRYRAMTLSSDYTIRG
ncbi:MAG: hypothetical protein ACREFL_06745 [Stellaceae bacterium]